MKIKANEKLFNKWKKLADRIGFFAPQIVQNDMEISIEDIQEHFKFVDGLRQEFNDLNSETNTYIFTEEEENENKS